MSKRDMIIIAVLVNLGVLAIIFMTAIGFDDDHIAGAPTSNEVLVEATQSSEPSYMEHPQELHGKATGGDEVDRVLNMYAAQDINKNGATETIIVATPTEDHFEVNPVQTAPAQSAKSAADEEAAPQLVEITVKKGDFLDKIARANGTTADRLMQINHLASDRIDIGQVLKVPVSNAKKSAGTTTAKKEKKADSAKTSASSDAQYYTVKNGDNPWKIARQFHVKFDDLLKLNHLDEEKARNLKVGDKIRVK